MNKALQLFDTVDVVSTLSATLTWSAHPYESTKMITADGHNLTHPPCTGSRLPCHCVPCTVPGPSTLQPTETILWQSQTWVSITDYGVSHSVQLIECRLVDIQFTTLAEKFMKEQFVDQIVSNVLKFIWYADISQKDAFLDGCLLDDNIVIPADFLR